MAKSTKKRTQRQKSVPSRKQSRPAKPGNKRKSLSASAVTKQSVAIEMLRSPNGATIDRLMKVTGWQQHSVRGFLAGVVRKRLGLILESKIVEGSRLYRIGRGAPEQTAKSKKA